MNKLIISFVAIICISQGCKNNPLDITPDGRVTLDSVFQNEQQVEAYLNTVYGQIPVYFYSYGDGFSFLAGVTDDAKESNTQNGTVFNKWLNGGLTPNGNSLMNYYGTYWSGIRYANVFLANIDKANVPSKSNKNRMKAEAYVLRAFYYWQLIKEYGPMPYITIPLNTSYDFASLKRPSFQEDVDSILADCERAIANPDLPIRITKEANRGRMTKAVAYALESEATLFNASSLWNPNHDQQKWEQAATVSKDALDALTEDGEYALWKGSWDAYFLNESDMSTNPKDKETILERNGAAGSHLINHENIPSKVGVAKSGTNPSQELVDSYDMANGKPAITGYDDADHLQPKVNTSSGYDPQNPYLNRDPRFYATVWYNGAQYDNVNGNIHTIETFSSGADQLTTSPVNVINTHTGYYLRKFVDPELQIGQASNATWKIFRLAEIYLNLAEAENEAKGGPNNISYAAIDSIRNRVSMPDLPQGLSQEEFRNRVRNERRIELAMEGKRFWDVRRWKILDQTDKLVTGMNITKISAHTFTYKRFVVEKRETWEDKYLIFPIPVADASVIPDFSDHQNPGW